MKRKFLIATIGLISTCILGGCGSTRGDSSNNAGTDNPSKNAESDYSANSAVIDNSSEDNIEKPEISNASEDTDEASLSGKTDIVKEDTNDKKTLAERMTGKYSYHYSGDNEEDEYYIMNVVNFGDNLYAYCGQAMSDDEIYEAYSFWATEFIPYDADELSSNDGDKVKVNALNFSIMSNVGKYWDSGHTGTITLTDDGLVFEGFDKDGFLAPYDSGESRLFLKNERVEDFFSYLKEDNAATDADLQGYWRNSEGDVDSYIRIVGSNMYFYNKAPDQEVFFAAGGCDFHDGYFEFMGNKIDSGGQPFEFTADYKVEGDSLFVAIQGPDAPAKIPGEAEYERISEQDIHVTTMDEVVFNDDSFGPFGEIMKEPFYGLWVGAFNNEADAEALVAKLEGMGLPASYVFSCDWEELNKEPYYCVTIVRASTKAEAEAYMDDAKGAGYGSAYVKYTGNYIKSSDAAKAESLLKEMSDAMSGFLWATMMQKSDYNSLEADNIVISLSDEDKMRAAALACSSDYVIDSTFVLGMGGFSEDKNADTGPEGDGFHGVLVSKKDVEQNCIDLFGMKADWNELPIGPFCDLYDAVKYSDGKDNYALIVEREVETETALENHECVITEEEGKYIGKVNMFWGYWGELDQKPGYSNYVVTYTLEPNDESKYGMVITSISIKRK